MDIKKIKIAPIDSKSAREFIKNHHYSGKVCSNSQINFGCIYENKLIGCLQYGPSTDKRKMALNMKCGMNEFLELNRMAMINDTPKNTESRVIAITLRILKKQYPFLKFIISFADACQCGDGTIYRASGFDLINIKKNNSLMMLNNGQIVSDKTMNNSLTKKKSWYVDNMGAKPIAGFQFKYVYFFDKELREKFKIIPFKEIPFQCRMYKGMRLEHESNVGNFQLSEEGAIPIKSLQSLSQENPNDFSKE